MDYCEIAKLSRDLAVDLSCGQCTSASVRPIETKTNTDTNIEWDKFIQFYFEMGLKYGMIKTVLSSRLT